MKFSTSVLAGTLILGIAAVAQTGPAVRWAEGAPNATSEVKNDAKIEGLKADDVQIYVSMVDIKDTEYNRVWVQISNHGKTPIDFDPQSVVLVSVGKGKTLSAEPAAKTANAIVKFGEAKSQELSSAKCENMVAMQCQPTSTQMQVAKQISAYSAQQAQWVRDNAFAKTTLAPGQQVQGMIYFKKEHKAADYIVRCPVGIQTFEFPQSAQNKAPSYD